VNESGTLYIPMGVKTEAEFFPGFGRKEFLQASAGSLIFGAVAFAVYFIGGGLANAMIALLAGIAGSVMMTVKDQYNMSVVTQLANLVRFARSQKVYPYVCGKEWGEF
jgi:hypothetical protein